MRPTLILLLIMLAACGKAPEPRSTTMSNASPLQAIPDDLEKQLAFTCSYEAKRIPKRDAEAEQLFLHARWLYKQNRLKDDPAKYPAIERLYRIAAAWGHDKANRNLALMMLRGQSDAPDIISLPVELAQDMIQRGVPAGYYDMGVLLTKGYGVKGDDASALQYMRHAADLGHPDAQYYVGELLNGLTITHPTPFRIGYEMKKCAAEQGHAKAANEYAVHLQDKENYPDALKYYQMAVRAGSSPAASTLKGAFLSPLSPEGTLDYLGLPKDEERSRRYEILWRFLHNASYLNPTVDDIDDIVPLPPAKLPPWDGKTKWQKAWDSGEAPPLPSEERINEMARAKGLDPATGRPLPKPEPQAAAPVAPTPAASPIGTQAHSGQRCPQAGTWECQATQIEGERRRTFACGQTLPPVMAPVARTLWQTLRGTPDAIAQDTVWTLVVAAGEDSHAG